MPSKIDLARKRFGRLIVLAGAGNAPDGKILWCLCPDHGVARPMTYTSAIKRRDQLIEARQVLRAAHKGTPYLDKELQRVTTWLVAYANRQERKQVAA